MTPEQEIIAKAIIRDHAPESGPSSRETLVAAVAAIRDHPDLGPAVAAEVGAPFGLDGDGAHILGETNTGEVQPRHSDSAEWAVAHGGGAERAGTGSTDAEKLRDLALEYADQADMALQQARSRGAALTDVAMAAAQVGQLYATLAVLGRPPLSNEDMLQLLLDRGVIEEVDDDGEQITDEPVDDEDADGATDRPA